MEILWLSRGRILNSVFELKYVLHKYFQETNRQDVAKCFEDEHWLQRLSYLANIFHHMNQLYKSLLCHRENILTSSNHILALQRKVNLWKNHDANGNLEMFLLLLELKNEDGCQKALSLVESYLVEVYIRF